MSLIDDAISIYESAARMVAGLLEARVDLLSSGLAVLNSQPSIHLAGGYKDVGTSLGVCLPADSRATIARSSLAEAAATAPSIEVLTSDLDWMTFEGWLAVANARTCFVEAELHADRPITADVFVRRLGGDGGFRDAKPIEWRLPLGGPALLEVPLEPAEEGERRKVVISLRNPPERMIMRRLALTSLP